MLASSRAISSFRSWMRSASSSTERSARSWPISCAIFFFGRSSSSGAGIALLRQGRHHSRSRLRWRISFSENRRPLFRDMRPLSRRAAATNTSTVPHTKRRSMTLPARMTAIGIRAPGGPEMLVPEERPVPTPGDGEILVKVAAAGVNRPDVMQRMGLYPPPKGAPDIPGLEIAGMVAACGPGATRWKVGDAVAALVVGGGYAQYCLAHETHALPAPEGLSMVEAAALPETVFTVWHNVFERGALKAGETLLVHGGSSGIGTTAIQLAKNFGAKVVTTAGSTEKCDACRKLGADVAVNYK